MFPDVNFPDDWNEGLDLMDALEELNNPFSLEHDNEIDPHIIAENPFLWGEDSDHHD